MNDRRISAPTPLTLQQEADVMQHFYATHAVLHDQDESKSYRFCEKTGFFDYNHNVIDMPTFVDRYVAVLSS